MQSINRRQWLRAGVGSLVFTLGGARLALASGGEHAPNGRLVIVLLRGALDGLAAVPPLGDPDFARLRPALAEEAERVGAPLKLNADFALHPKLATLHQWYGQGELLVLHATAMHYRERSHFDAQQLIESGGRRPFEQDTGWLARALNAHGGGSRAVALGTGLPLALRGTEGATHWSPAVEAAPDEGLMAALARLYAADARLAPVFARARERISEDAARLAADVAGGPPSDAAKMAAGHAMVSTDMSAATTAERGTMAAPAPARADRSFATLATQAGRFLAEPEGARIAWLELGGWDTHAQQAPRLAAQLAVLDAGLAALRRNLGAQWAQTSLLVMTEFGRSAAFNGSGGTDHGTGGIALLAGGGVAGGRVLGDWPGLAVAKLHEGRDLRPTTDLRALQRALIEVHLPLASATLERNVLPGAPPALRDLWRRPPATA